MKLPFFQCSSSPFTSELYNEKSFYKAFLKDLKTCQKEVIIESPYITTERMKFLFPVFQRLLHKGIEIHLITRDPADHEDAFYRNQSTNEILKCAEIGIRVETIKGFHHRKIAIIDRKLLWEGSLNILSQINSKEIMRRIESKEESKKMFDFIGLCQYV